MKISIIVLNWNGKKYINDCLTSIFYQSYKDFEVIFVDNASTDGSINFIKDSFPNVKIIQNKENYGFAKGNNIGIRKAKGEYILILNTDTKLDKDFLKEIIKPTKDPKVGMISSKATYFDTKKIDTIGIKVFISGLSKDVKTEKEASLAIVPSGVAALYKKDMLEDIKLNGQYFDEDYFVYSEDLDLGLRAILRGWKFVHVPKAEVLHIHSASTRKSSDYIQLLGHRNIIWTILKNFPTTSLIKYSIPIILMQLTTIAYYFLKLKPILILKLKFSALMSIGKMLKKRKIIQQRRKISSKEFEKLLIKKFI